MSYVDTWLPDTLDALRALRGETARDAGGAPMPALSPLDSVAVLGQLAGGVVSAVGNAMMHHTGQQKLAPSAFVFPDGRGWPLGATVWAAENAGIMPAAYVAGFGQAGAPWRRSLALPKPGDDFFSVSSETWEPFYEESATDEPALFRYLRTLMADWQRAVEASASLIMGGGVDLTQRGNVDALRTFLQKVGTVCSDLDTLRENPPVSNADKWRGALNHAASESSRFVGKAAAEAANTIGQIAGAGVEGFLSGSSITALIVAGLAVYWFVL